MKHTIKNVVVMGAGVMGAQIAAHIANAGIHVALLDRVVDPQQPNLLADTAFKQLKHPKSGAFMTTKVQDLVSIGNFEEAESYLNHADLVIEAVAEVLDIKHAVWKLITCYTQPKTILATNTSGIPIQQVSSELTSNEKEYFLGMHFFNPPRFMKLLELIPLAETKDNITQQLKFFSEITLGKGVVIAKDTTNFIGNRIGVFSSIDILKRSQADKLSISEVDALTGTLLGRPKSATFRTGDLVGLDILYNVAKNMSGHEDRAYFSIPPILETLVSQKLLGNKTKAGFYKKDKELGITAFDNDSQTYLPISKINSPFITQLKKLPLEERLRVIFEPSEDSYHHFTWETLRNIMWYAAKVIPESTDDYLDIDRAMVWGYNWEIGIFKMWDILGKDAVIERMEAEGLAVPEWLKERQEPFYTETTSLTSFSTEASLTTKLIQQNSDSKLVDFGDHVLGFKIESINNTITTDLTYQLNQAMDFLEDSDYQGLVIYAPGKNFSVGANLYDILTGIKSGNWQQLSEEISYLQQTTKRLKFFTKPIVSAVHGRALGGGAELLLHSPFVVAAAESYIGLVEVGVGLIPGGGGTKELMVRSFENVANQPTVRVDPFLKNAFKTIFSAYVSTSAFEAKEKGYLRDRDDIVMNDDRLLDVAKEKVLYESQLGYREKQEVLISALGEDANAAFDLELLAMKDGRFISEYDFHIGQQLAQLITLASKAKGTPLSEDAILTLEKETFINLAKETKTQERMLHMLQTGKPLRN